MTWQVAAGDTVKVNDIVVEIETAKSLVELPIPWAGTVAELLVAEGQTVRGRHADHLGRGGRGRSDAPAGGEPRAAAVASGTAGVASPSAGGAPGGAPQREPNLVGYGAIAGSTKRRPRKGGVGPGPRRRHVDLRWHVGRSAAAPQPAAAIGRRWGTDRSAAGEAAGAQVRQGPRRRPHRGDGHRRARGRHPGRRRRVPCARCRQDGPGGSGLRRDRDFGGSGTRGSVSAGRDFGGIGPRRGRGLRRDRVRRHPTYRSRQLRVPWHPTGRTTVQRDADPGQGRAQDDGRGDGRVGASPRRTSPSGSPSTSPRRWSWSSGSGHDREFRDVKVTPLLVVAKALLPRLSPQPRRQRDLGRGRRGDRGQELRATSASPRPPRAG